MTQANGLFFCIIFVRSNCVNCRNNKLTLEPHLGNRPKKSKGAAATKAKSEFRINARNLFLTYPKCDLEPEEALSLLRPELDFEDYVIAQEMHADGTPHLHVWLQARGKKKFNIREPTKLDLLHPHGNYQAARSVSAIVKYVTKDGKWISNLPLEEVEALKKPSKSKTTKVPVIVITPPQSGASTVTTATITTSIQPFGLPAITSSLQFDHMLTWFK